ncbi:hypothetical protein ES288_D01G003400v1 [Gossypium darwinii]|nr:hypothetical protein ES288_D01G003400v1 [Gossypium darwinii]TYG81421.1 hypothetical protein ES288_D01G003400v1 [Gossypium darwinii]
MASNEKIRPVQTNPSRISHLFGKYLSSPLQSPCLSPPSRCPPSKRIQICSIKTFMVDFLNYRPRVPFYLHFGKPGLFSKKKPLKVGYSFCQ